MSTFELLLAAVAGTLTIARLTRLVVDDEWPPILVLRQKYVQFLGWIFLRDADEEEKSWEEQIAKVEAWEKLIDCPFCLSFWVALGAAPLTWLSYNGDSQLDWWWWIPTLVMSTSYVAAMVNVRDIPPEE